MREITYNNKVYNIPTCWDEVTVEMLINSSEYAEMLPDATVIAIISAYTRIPIKELKMGNIAEVNTILSSMEFLNTPYQPKPDNEFEFEGNTYRCQEELVEQNFEDWVSVQTALYNYRDNMARVLPKLLAIMCKKEGETLDDFNLNERTTMFMKLPMTKAKDIESFFLSSLHAYKTVILLSSTLEIQEELVLGKVLELQNTLKAYRERTGISWLTRLQIGILRIYLWYLKRQLVKYFNSIRTKPIKKTFKQTLKNWLMSIVKGKARSKVVNNK